MPRGAADSSTTADTGGKPRILYQSPGTAQGRIARVAQIVEVDVAFRTEHANRGPCEWQGQIGLELSWRGRRLA